MTTFNYSDFVTKCAACNGAGHVYNPNWRDVSMLTWTNAELQTFIRLNGNAVLPCGECDGTGERLTDAGEALSRVVTPMLQRAVDAALRRHVAMYHGA